MISVRQTSVLLTAFFRFHLTMDTLCPPVLPLDDIAAIASAALDHAQPLAAVLARLGGR